MNAFRRKNMLAALVVLGTGMAASGATTFDPAAGFSAASNPNGVWTYGYSTTLTSALNVYDVKQNMAGLDYWESSKVNQLTAPNVSHNGTASSISTGTIVVAPNGLSMHPGPNGEYTHVIFTATTAGTYNVAGSFSSVDVGGTTTDVHVLENTSSLFSGNVNGTTSSTVPFTLNSITLAAGDKIDFAVGDGVDGSFSGDTTGLSAQITQTGTGSGTGPSAVPLPAAVWPGLGMISVLGLALVGYKRRQIA